MSQAKFTNQYLETRKMRPADCFEPGFDTITFKPPVKNVSPSKTSTFKIEKS